MNLLLINYCPECNDNWQGACLGLRDSRLFNEVPVVTNVYALRQHLYINTFSWGNCASIVLLQGVYYMSRQEKVLNCLEQYYTSTFPKGECINAFSISHDKLWYSFHKVIECKLKLPYIKNACIIFIFINKFKAIH